MGIRGKERGKRGFTYVDHVELFLAYVNPTDQEKHPCQTEEGDEGGVQGDQKAERTTTVFPKGLESLLDLGTARVQHMSDVVVKKFDVLLTESFEGGIVREDGILRFRTQDRG